MNERLGGTAAGPGPRGRLNFDVLPACRSRCDMAGTGEFALCTNPAVRTPNGLTTIDICRSCGLWERGDSRLEIRRESGDVVGQVCQWSVGVTTAPRASATLSQCLESLQMAGWSRPRLFAEPETEIPSRWADLPITLRDTRLGAFPNWYLGLAELLMREPDADAYFMIQDDSILATNLRTYLERMLWPGPSVGVVSVYCPAHSSVNRDDGFHPLCDGWRAWGALAYIFPRESALELLGDVEVLRHRFEGPNGGLRNIDSVVGAWCERADRGYFVHVPSLVQHVGETSTLYPGATASGNRRAAEFVDDARILVNGEASAVDLVAD